MTADSTAMPALPRREVSPGELAEALELIRVHGSAAAVTAALRTPSGPIPGTARMLRLPGASSEARTPGPPPPLAPTAISPLMPRTYREVLRAIELGVCTPVEARTYYGLPARRRRWWSR